MYKTEIRNGKLVVHFGERPTRHLQKHLLSYGGVRYGKDWWFSEDIPEVKKFLKSWAGNMRTHTSSERTLCWRCKNACGGCPWSAEGKPVRGWNAKQTVTNYHRNNGARLEISGFCVKECPMFSDDEIGRPHLTTDNENRYIALAAAIIKQALLDLENAETGAERNYIEKFFASDWCDVLTNGRKEAVIDAIKRDML
jgi:hypothetical protein